MLTACALSSLKKLPYSEMGCVTFMFGEVRPFFELRNHKMSPLFEIGLTSTNIFWLAKDTFLYLVKGLSGPME